MIALFLQRLASIGRRRRLHLLFGAIVFAALQCVVPSAAADADTGLPINSESNAAAIQQLESLVATIEDEDKRTVLIEQLRALITAQAGDAAEPELETLGTKILAVLSERTDAVRREMLTAVDAVQRVPQLFAWLRAQVTQETFRDWWMELIPKVVLTLVCGYLVERLVRASLRHPRRLLEESQQEKMLLRVVYLLGRTVLDVFPIAAFGVTAYVLLPLLDPSETARLVALTLINAMVIARAVMAGIRMQLSPKAASLRLFPISDLSANYWYKWAQRLTQVAVYGYFIAEAAVMLGLPVGPHAILMKLLGLIVSAMGVVVVLQNRVAAAAYLRSSASEPGKEAAVGETEQSGDDTVSQSPIERGLPLLRSRIADIWHVLAIIYIATILAVWVLEIPGGFEYLAKASLMTVVILAVAALMIAGLRRAIDRRFAIRPEVLARFPILEVCADRYLPILKLVTHWIVCLFAGGSLLQAWGIDAWGWLDLEIGQRVLASSVTIAIIVVMGLVGWEVISHFIERALQRAEARGGPEQSARIMTLLPLLRRTLLLVLLVMISLVILSEVGIDIAPLLASAGVIGLAIGFGAQTLVKDVITGLFILIEDTIAVGDYVEVGGHEGTVESLTIRTVRLRDPSGSVHTVPFSDVSTVLNYTRDYAYAVLNIGVAYRENIDEVILVIQQIGQEMMEDPSVAPNILAPIQVQGLNSFEDSAVVIRARIKVIPGYQWGMRRHFNRLMKNRFDELGIEIPFPHQTIFFGADKEGKAPPATIRLEQPADDRTEKPGKPSAAPPLPPATGEDRSIPGHDVEPDSDA